MLSTIAIKPASLNKNASWEQMCLTWRFKIAEGPGAGAAALKSKLDRLEGRLWEKN